MARSTFGGQNVQSTSVSDDFWKLRCPKSARCCGAKQCGRQNCTTLHSTTLHYITLHYTPQHYKYNYATRYTLDRRPWHEMGILGKNSMFFNVPNFCLDPNYCEAALQSLFSSLLQKSFQLVQEGNGSDRHQTLSKDPLIHHRFDVF